MSERYPIPGTRLWRDAEGLVVLDPHRAEAMRVEEAYRKTLDDTTCMSFEEWRDAGFFVRRGMKSVFRDITNVPQFTKEQVYGQQSPDEEDY